jgi:seryl-tRNA synthetase
MGRQLHFDAIADHAHDRVELQSTLVDLEVSRERERKLQTELDQLKQAAAKMNEDFKREISQSQNRNHELEGRLDQLRGQRAAQNQGLQQTTVSLTHQISVLQARNNELIEQLDELQDSHDALQVSFNEQEQSIEEVDRLNLELLKCNAVNESLDRWRSAFIVVVLGLALHWLLMARPDIASALTPLIDSDVAPHATALLDQVNQSMACNSSGTPPAVNSTTSTVLRSACQCPPITMYDVAPHIGLFIGVMAVLLACVKFGKRILHVVSSAAPSYLAQSIPIDVSRLLPFDLDDSVSDAQLGDFQVAHFDPVEAIEPLPELQSDVNEDYDDCEHSLAGARDVDAEISIRHPDEQEYIN